MVMLKPLWNVRKASIAMLRGFCMLAFFWSRSVAADAFYKPTSTAYGSPADKALSFTNVFFTSADGTPLHGWFVPAKGVAKGTVVHFHGNAQNMSAHFSFVSWLPERGFNLFTFDYRGYGLSKGTPTRNGVHADGIAALQQVRRLPGVDTNKLIVLGQSLGGAVAIAAVADGQTNGVQCVVVESTFDSYKAMGRDRAPDLLANMLVSDNHSPDKVVDTLSPVPVLFIHGTRDRVVPYARGKALFELAKEPKSMWSITGGYHTQAFTRYGATYRPALVKALNHCLENRRTQPD